MRPSTRAIVASSPATTATRKSGPYGFETDRTNAHVEPAPPRGAKGTSANSAAWSSSIARTPGAAARSVRRPLGAGRRHRRTSRVLRPAGDHNRRHPRVERTDETVHCRSIVVDREGHRLQAQRRHEIQQVRPAWVLDADPVARP